MGVKVSRTLTINLKAWIKVLALRKWYMNTQGSESMFHSETLKYVQDIE